MMKIGIEVEGRFEGLKTLFMTAREFLSRDVQNVVQLLTFHKVQQLYIVDHLSELDLCSSSFDTITKFCYVVITVERKTLEPAARSVLLRSPVELMLYVETPDVLRLRMSDQIKVGAGKHVFVTNIGSMTETVDSDYDNDQTLSQKGQIE